MIKNLLVIGLVAGFLAGCNSPKEIEENARAEGFEDNLPPGCKLKVPGRVNGDLIIVIYCDKKSSTSTVRHWTTSRYDPSTKVVQTDHHRSYVVYIGDEI